MTDEKMTREEISMLGFEIVAYAGDARSDLLEALKYARKSEFDKVDPLIAKAQENLNLAHNKQTKMLTLDAQGKDLEIGVIMIHAQDHLMTSLLLKDLILDFVELYKRTSK
jgi:PTS system lactose-specific IIA component